ncbi:(p)ppGpp synthetase [Campylobacterota bacterium]|nr:(p)ppGpp synthetase [Campylobacterota bacterium]
MAMFSRKAINRSGEILVSNNVNSQEYESALQMLNDWRALHLVPLNTFQATLRSYVKSVAGRNSIVAQRLKRVPTILDKMQNRQQQMQLGRMQDVGGLRAIVASNELVRKIERKYDRSRTKHHLERKSDYIAVPKASGYRGIHIVYKYSSPEKPDYDGLFIEIQLRTKLQHLWATAVETVDFFFLESLKYSQGADDWQKFFKLVSAIFALMENEQPHTDFQAMTKEQLIAQLLEFDRDKHLVSRLETIKVASFAKKDSQLSKAAYWVIETTLNGHSSIKVHPFLESQKDSADLTYRQLEQSSDRKIGKKQVVLISVDSVSKIEKAYPNFFGDIEEFLKTIQRIAQQ